MDPLQFSLFFAALLIAYVLVHMRLVKFETYLREIGGLKQLNDRLKGVAEAMERIKVERLEDGLQLLHEDARDIGDTLQKVETGVGVVHTDSGGAVIPSGEASVPERICSAVEEQLFRLGYQNLRILTDLRHIHIEDEVEVQVECEKQMMRYKGKVLARNSSILNVDLQPVVEMFP